MASLLEVTVNARVIHKETFIEVSTLFKYNREINLGYEFGGGLCEYLYHEIIIITLTVTHLLSHVGIIDIAQGYERFLD